MPLPVIFSGCCFSHRTRNTAGTTTSAYDSTFCIRLSHVDIASTPASAATFLASMAMATMVTQAKCTIVACAEG